MHLLHTTSLYTSLSLLLLEPLPVSKAFKIILMYAPCDSYLTNMLHLVHRAARQHYDFHEDTQMRKKPRHSVHHVRHDLSNACMWVLQRTVAVIAVSNATKIWTGIDVTAHRYNLPHMVTPQFCNCSPNFPKSRRYSRLLDFAVFEYLEHTYLHDVIMLHEEDNEDGTLLTSLLSSQSIRVSHLGVQSGPGFLKTVERYFEKWNMVDLSDEGRLLVSLAGGQHVDRLLRKLVQTSMHNKRTKLLVVDDPEKWQERLLSVKAYEVDLVIVGSESLTITDCPTAIELLPSGSHSHKTEGKCKKLSPNDRKLGDRIITEIQKNLTSCCSRVTENDYTFWRSSLSENGTQRLKAIAVWSSDLGILRMETIDVEMITLRIAIMEYIPYVIFNVTDGEVILQKCVFKEMISFLSKRLHFRYELVTPPDEEWGSFIDGKWIGAIGMVTRGEADIIPYLTLTPSRHTVMDYSKPLAAVKYGILVAFPSEPPRAFIFLRPYRKEVWCLCVIAAILMSYMLYLMHKWSCKICKIDKKQTKELASYSRCFWLIYGATLQQGGTHLPVTNSARLVLSSWWIGVMVIMATYSANLIAFLAFPETKWIVKSLGDLAKHKSIQVTIKRGCPVLEDFQESNIKIFEQIRKIYLKNPLRFRIINRRNSKILDDVAAGKTVFIDDMNYLAKMVETDYQNHNRCRITIAPSTFSRKDFSLGLRRGSSLMPALNAEIQQMKESGVLRHWKDNHSPQRDECYDITTILQNHSVKVTLEDLQGPFYLLVLGLLLGMISLTSEFLWTRTKIAYKRYMKRKFFIRHFHPT